MPNPYSIDTDPISLRRPGTAVTPFVALCNCQALHREMMIRNFPTDLLESLTTVIVLAESRNHEANGLPDSHEDISVLWLIENCRAIDHASTEDGWTIKIPVGASTVTICYTSSPHSVYRWGIRKNGHLITICRMLTKGMLRNLCTVLNGFVPPPF